jgi:DNA-binding MarR family transcriptional regulator
MSPQFTVFPRQESPGFLIYRTACVLKAGLKRAFQAEGLGVTPEQWSVLSTLWEDEGVHQSMLAAKTAKDRHNMTRILNLLAKGGLVIRKPSPVDRRCQRVYLTSRGQTLAPKLIEIVTAFLGSAMDGVSEEDLAQLKRILGRIIHNVEREEDSDEASASQAPCDGESS